MEINKTHYPSVSLCVAREKIASIPYEDKLDVPLPDFDSLYKKFHEPAIDVALKYTADRSHAEDLVQNIFLKLWEQRSELPRIRDFRNYLFVAVRNEFLKHKKRAGLFVYVPDITLHME